MQGGSIIFCIIYHDVAGSGECIQAFNIEIGIRVVVPSDGYKGMGHSLTHKLGRCGNDDAEVILDGHYTVYGGVWGWLGRVVMWHVLAHL